jgi:AICAR transformylase/IMP cyclohydrolase PurH
VCYFWRYNIVTCWHVTWLGSAEAIEAAGVCVKKVEDLSGFPEMLDGDTTLVHVG